MVQVLRLEPTQEAGIMCLANCNSVVQQAPSFAQKAYKSFDAFKRSVGAADPTGQNLRQWHHIVEQTNKNKEQLGQFMIQNGKNIVNIPTEIHRQVSGYYSSIQPFTNGVTVRTWLSSQSFKEQAEFDQKILDKAINNLLK